MWRRFPPDGAPAFFLSERRSQAVGARSPSLAGTGADDADTCGVAVRAGTAGGILPRVVVVMAAAVMALVSAGLCGRAVRDRRPVLFLAAWLAGLIGALVIWLGFASLVGYGLEAAPFGAAVVEPLSSAGAVGLLPQLPFVVSAIGAGAVIAAVLAWSRPRTVANADAPCAPSQEARAAGIGEVGERLVACKLAVLGWPALHNVILAGARGRTVELDHVVRAPDGIVVLETKTYSGFIAGGADAPRWTQHRAGGQQISFLNPAIQNLSHVRAVERFVADPAVRFVASWCRPGTRALMMRSRTFQCRCTHCARFFGRMRRWCSRVGGGLTRRGGGWSARRRGARADARRTSPMRVASGALPRRWRRLASRHTIQSSCVREGRRLRILDCTGRRLAAAGQ